MLTRSLFFNRKIYILFRLLNIILVNNMELHKLVNIEKRVAELEEKEKQKIIINTESEKKLGYELLCRIEIAANKAKTYASFFERIRIKKELKNLEEEVRRKYPQGFIRYLHMRPVRRSYFDERTDRINLNKILEDRSEGDDKC